MDKLSKRSFITFYFSRNITLLLPWGWVHKATLGLRPFLICCASISDFLTTPDLSTRALRQLPADTRSNEAGDTW
jgi:predicted membrane chloride channel (bestrophin family)